MVFNSVPYLFFFPVAALVYFILPKKAGNIWLLAASFFFYMNWEPVYALLLLTTVVITYTAAILIEKYKGMRKAKGILFLSLFCNLSILVWFKYSGFLVDNLNVLTKAFGIAPLGKISVVLPVGISFYIFQALGYTMDVYYGRIAAEKRFLRYALFVSFFPQLVAGPIERSKNLLPQFDKKHGFDAERVKSGLYTMLWGLFIKMVIADRVALIVDAVFDQYLAYSGIEIAVAAMLFTLQIYCDFAGYSYIAIGSARVLGFTLMENFRSPLLAESIRDFWRGWHISLTSWFTDYLYIPLGGNRKGEMKKNRNTLIVFFVSGLWHGADWTYVIWGVMNGVYLILQQEYTKLKTLLLKGRKSSLSGGGDAGENAGRHDESEKTVAAAGTKTGEKRPGLLKRIICMAGTYLAVSFSFLFFRAKSAGQALGMLSQAKANPGLPGIAGSLWTHLYEAGQLYGYGWAALIAALLILLFVDALRKAGKDPLSLFISRPAAVKWVCVIALLFLIVLFGIYGNEYAQTQFIYFQF